MNMYLNALDNQVLQDSEMISLNYLPSDSVPLNAKFTLNQTVHELQVQAKLKLSRLFWSVLQAKTQTSP